MGLVALGRLPKRSSLFLSLEWVQWQLPYCRGLIAGVCTWPPLNQGFLSTFWARAL